MDSRHFAIYAKQYTVLFHFTFFSVQNPAISYLFYFMIKRTRGYPGMVAHYFVFSSATQGLLFQKMKNERFIRSIRYLLTVLIERNATWNAISNPRNKKRGANIKPQHPAAAVWNISRCNQHYSCYFTVENRIARGALTIHVHVIRSHTCVRTWFLIARRGTRRYEL